MSTLTLPEVTSVAANHEDDVCHIFCICRPRITLCGAYNTKYPHTCGDVGVHLVRKRCRGCGKKVCKDCKSLLRSPCPSCGNV